MMAVATQYPMTRRFTIASFDGRVRRLVSALTDATSPM
ncbi:hypothetical protein AKJ09_10673 [Labilithrix luteola]|uniref:Uncharacterized protein n=1 Tax=Labilithrix luteola TaxID=1391654 RepID=A0A0K1QEZ7_9BACT|nr:hypothetical protein AKJ09_10673 [Labilithrix luteola]